MQDKVFYIYKITNKTNNKIYIGKSINPIKRFKMHIYLALNTSDKQLTKLYRSIRKYGANQFNLEIIDSFTNEDDCYQSEAAYIKNYNCINAGMNTKPGGKGGYATGTNHPMYGRKATQQTINKMSASHMGHKVLDSTKQKQSLAQAGSKSHFSKLRENDVIIIKQQLSAGTKVKIIAKQFNVSVQTIYYIKSGTTWKSQGDQDQSI